MLKINIFIFSTLILLLHYGLSLQRKTSVVQKDPDQLIDKLISFVLHVHGLVMKHSYNAADIIAMDDIPIWVDMV